MKKNKNETSHLPEVCCGFWWLKLKVSLTPRSDHCRPGGDEIAQHQYVQVVFEALLLVCLAFLWDLWGYYKLLKVILHYLLVVVGIATTGGQGRRKDLTVYPLKGV